MSVQTASVFFAVLALLALGGVVVVALGAAGHLLPSVRPRLAPLRADLGRASLGLAWLVATVAMLGSLYYSEIAGFTPCPLCWYQRICMYPLAVVLGVAALRRDRDVRFYVLPVALVGAVIASYHAWIQAFPPASGSAFCTVDAPCTDRFVWEFGFVSLPFMALCGFLFIATMMLLARPERRGPTADASTHPGADGRSAADLSGRAGDETTDPSATSPKPTTTSKLVRSAR
jgi:hypothetical protein